MMYIEYNMQIVTFDEEDSFVCTLINSGDGESVDSVPGTGPSADS